MALADPSDGDVHRLLQHSLLISLTALRSNLLQEQLRSLIHDGALMRRLGRLLAAGHALLVDEAQPADEEWCYRYHCACMFIVSVEGLLEAQAPLLGAALPMLEPAVHLLARLPMAPPSGARLDSYGHMAKSAVWLVSALTDFRLRVLQSSAQADLQRWAVEAQGAAAEAASGGSEAVQQVLTTWLGSLPAAVRCFEALLPGQPLADGTAASAGLAPTSYALCLMRFGAACEAAASWSAGELQMACTADEASVVRAAAAAEALLRQAPKLFGLLPHTAVREGGPGLHPIAVAMRRTLALAFNLIVPIYR